MSRQVALVAVVVVVAEVAAVEESSQCPFPVGSFLLHTPSVSCTGQPGSSASARSRRKAPAEGWRQRAALAEYRDGGLQLDGNQRGTWWSAEPTHSLCSERQRKFLRWGCRPDWRLGLVYKYSLRSCFH